MATMPHGDLPTRRISAASTFTSQAFANSTAKTTAKLGEGGRINLGRPALPLLISWPLRVVQKGRQLYLLISWIGGLGHARELEIRFGGRGRVAH